MATLTPKNIPTSELIRREMPDGSLAERIDILSTSKELLNYLTWIPCNNGNYHEDKQVVAKPTPAERAYGQGFPVGASVTDTVVEPTCMLGSFVNVDYIQLQQQSPGGNSAGVLNDEEQTHIDSDISTLITRLFTGDRGTYANQINGLTKRTNWSSLGQTYTKASGTRKYIYDNAAGNCASGSVHGSIWILQFGPKMVNLIYPQHGAQGGVGNTPVKRTPFTPQVVNDSNDSSKKLVELNVLIEMDFGLFIHDPRCIKRICNIYMSTSPDGSTKVEFNEEVLMEATNELEYGGANAIICCSNAMAYQMRKRANQSGSLWTQQTEGEGPWARPILRFDGHPIVKVDELTDTEARIS